MSLSRDAGQLVGWQCHTAPRGAALARLRKSKPSCSAPQESTRGARTRPSPGPEAKGPSAFVQGGRRGLGWGWQGGLRAQRSLGATGPRSPEQARQGIVRGSGSIACVGSTGALQTPRFPASSPGARAGTSSSSHSRLGAVLCPPSRRNAVPAGLRRPKCHCWCCVSATSHGHPPRSLQRPWARSLGSSSGSYLWSLQAEGDLVFLTLSLGVPRERARCLPEAHVPFWVGRRRFGGPKQARNKM